MTSCSGSVLNAVSGLSTPGNRLRNSAVSVTSDALVAAGVVVCLEAARGAENGRVRRAVGVDPQGQKDVGYEAEDADIEFSLQNADYQPRDAVDRDGRADHPRFASEPTPPEVVTEDHDLASPWPILVGKEGPSAARAPTEQAKETGADHRNGQRLGSRAAGQVPRAEAVRGEVLNPRGLLLKQIEDGRGHLRPAASRGTRPRQEDDDAFGVRIGQRLQQDGVHYREDGRARPETQRQRGDRSQREAGRSRETANGHPQVLEPHHRRWGARQESWGFAVEVLSER